MLSEMYRRYFRWWDFFLLVIAIGHVIMAPYTKLEESFNVQATHDLLYWKWDLAKYDHLEFPGVVPRTFIGAIVLATLSAPFVIPLQLFRLPKLYALYAVRITLATMLVACLAVFRRKVESKFGPRVASAYAIVVASQFHFLFYCSRPLPNVFAMAIVMLSYAYLLEDRAEAALRLLVFVVVVFRCDMLLLLVPIGIHLLMTHSIPLMIHCGLSTAVTSLALSVLIDSVFWRRSIWPEGEVLWFNTVLNRSSDWGVSPAHWYFTSALPRSMLVAFPLALAGVLLERRLVPLVAPVICFVFLYSRLPHKEVRFIFPALPMLNLSAATALTRIYNNRRKPVWGFALAGAVSLLVASSAISWVMAAASYRNYPGAHALHVLHRREFEETATVRMREKRVHISVMAAMTGVSRFCEQRGREWHYSKEENIPPGLLSSKNFTHLVSEHATVPGFCCVESIEGFSHLQFRFGIPPIELVNEPILFLQHLNPSDEAAKDCGCRART